MLFATLMLINRMIKKIAPDISGAFLIHQNKKSYVNNL